MFQVEVVYPAGDRSLVLRTSANGWQEPVLPRTVSGDRWSFAFEHPARAVTFKPCLVTRDGEVFSRGTDYRARSGQPREVRPYFLAPTKGDVTVHDLVRRERTWRVEVYTPPGYGENTTRRYPVLYFQDGEHVFRPTPSLPEWKVDEALDQLDRLDLVEKVVVVAVHAGPGRNGLYTMPGWDGYRRFLVDDLVPQVDASFRTIPRPEHRTLCGASLGAVVALHVAWEHPGVFRNVVGYSGRFFDRDDLRARIASDEPRPLRIWLDSGSAAWPDDPSDNLERVRELAELLVDRGYRTGRDLEYRVFPFAYHNEIEWATRWHLPLQWLYGKV